MRAGQLLQPRNPADMVEMLVAVEQELDVAEPEAEPADVVRDEVGAGSVAVDQDMAGSR